MSDSNNIWMESRDTELYLSEFGFIKSKELTFNDFIVYNRGNGIYEFFQIWMNKKTGRVTVMEGDDYDILKRSQFCLYIPELNTFKLIMSLTPWYFREGLR